MPLSVYKFEGAGNSAAKVLIKGAGKNERLLGVGVHLITDATVGNREAVLTLFDSEGHKVFLYGLGLLAASITKYSGVSVPNIVSIYLPSGWYWSIVIENGKAGDTVGYYAVHSWSAFTKEVT